MPGNREQEQRCLFRAVAVHQAALLSTVSARQTYCYRARAPPTMIDGQSTNASCVFQRFAFVFVPTLAKLGFLLRQCAIEESALTLHLASRRTTRRIVRHCFRLQFNTSTAVRNFRSTFPHTLPLPGPVGRAVNSQMPDANKACTRPFPVPKPLSVIPPTSMHRLLINVRAPLEGHVIVELIGILDVSGSGSCDLRGLMEAALSRTEEREVGG